MLFSKPNTRDRNVSLVRYKCFEIRSGRISAVRAQIRSQHIFRVPGNHLYRESCVSKPTSQKSDGFIATHCMLYMLYMLYKLYKLYTLYTVYTLYELYELYELYSFPSVIRDPSHFAALCRHPVGSMSAPCRLRASVSEINLQDGIKKYFGKEIRCGTYLI